MRRAALPVTVIAVLAVGLFLGRGLLLGWFYGQLSSVSGQEGPYGIGDGRLDETVRAPSGPRAPVDGPGSATATVEAGEVEIDPGEPLPPVAAPRPFGSTRHRQVKIRVLTEDDVPIQGVRVIDADVGFDIAGRTDADGEAIVAVRKKDHMQVPVKFLLDGDGWAPGTVLVPPAVEEKEARLKPGARLAGRVEDDAGQFVAGAEVRAYPGGRPIENPWGTRTTTTDDAGEFFLDSLPVVGAYVEVDADGYVPFQEWRGAEALGEDVVLRIRSGRQVELFVRAIDGRGVVGATVRLRPRLKNGHKPRPIEAMTGEGGIAVAHGMPTSPDELRLSVEAPGHRPLTERHRGAEAAKEYFELHLAEPAAIISGRVIPESGDVLRGYVHFGFRENDKSRQHRADLDGRGRFRWEEAPTDRKITAWAYWMPEGGIRASGPFAKQPIDPLRAGEEREIELVVPRLVEVTARVLTGDTVEPAVGVKVGARYLDEPPEGATRPTSYGQTGVDGVAEMLMPPGRYRFWAQRGSWTATDLETDIAGETAEVVLRIDEGPTIAGRVLDGEGQPVADRRLRLRSGRFSRDTITDIGGEFYFGRLPALAYSLRIEGKGGEENGLVLEGLLPGEEGLTIHFLEGSISGRVLDQATGEGIRAQIQLSKHGSSGRGGRTVQSDGEGHFAVDGLSHGSWWYRARQKGYVDRWKRFSVDGEMALEIRLQREARLRLAGIPEGSSKASVSLFPPGRDKAAHGFRWKRGQKAEWGTIQPGAYRVDVHIDGEKRSLEMQLASGKTATFWWDKAR